MASTCKSKQTERASILELRSVINDGDCHQQQSIHNTGAHRHQSCPDLPPSLQHWLYVQCYCDMIVESVWRCLPFTDCRRSKANPTNYQTTTHLAQTSPLCLLLHTKLSQLNLRQTLGPWIDQSSMNYKYSQWNIARYIPNVTHSDSLGELCVSIHFDQSKVGDTIPRNHPKLLSPTSSLGLSTMLTDSHWMGTSFLWLH
jgi:hypothetical protein